MALAATTSITQDDRSAGGRLISLLRAVDACSTALRGAVEVIARPHDLTINQLLVAWSCRDADDGVCQSELAARTGVSPAQVSVVVEQLRRRGVMECHRGADDRRRQLWSLTLDGRGMIEKAQLELCAVAKQVGGLATLFEQDRLLEKLTLLSSAAKTPAGNSCGLRVMEESP